MRPGRPPRFCPASVQPDVLQQPDRPRGERHDERIAEVLQPFHDLADGFREAAGGMTAPASSPATATANTAAADTATETVAEAGALRP